MVPPVSMAPMVPSATTSLLKTPPTITKPIKPLLRRATLSGKVRTRDEAGLDRYSSSLSTPSSPSKRARTVTFNPMVEEQIFTSSPTALDIAKNLDVVRFEVRKSLDEHIKGRKEEGYNAIKQIFAVKSKRGGEEFAERSQDLKSHLLALTSYVSLLGRQCSDLIKAILECDWIGRDEIFAKIYVQFLGNLASAQGAWIGSVLGMLVDKFIGRK